MFGKTKYWMASKISESLAPDRSAPVAAARFARMASATIGRAEAPSGTSKVPTPSG